MEASKAKSKRPTRYFVPPKPIHLSSNKDKGGSVETVQIDTEADSHNVQPNEDLLLEPSSNKEFDLKEQNIRKGLDQNLPEVEAESQTKTDEDIPTELGKDDQNASDEPNATSHDITEKETLPEIKSEKEDFHNKESEEMDKREEEIPRKEELLASGKQETTQNIQPNLQFESFEASNTNHLENETGEGNLEDGKNQDEEKMSRRRQ